MSVRTFSGTHDFDPTVLADTDVEDWQAGYIVTNIKSGLCPRCERPLPSPPEYPAGSRITECRSIPICGRCGSDEATEGMDAACGIGWGLSPASCWPIPTDEIDERRARWMKQAQPAILSGDRLITEDGSTPVTIPCNTGGWAQYGTSEEPRI